jgi:hypothetical protein
MNSWSELITTTIEEPEHIKGVKPTIVSYTLFLPTKIMEVPSVAINI